MTHTFMEWVGIVFIALVVALGLSALLALPFMWLWNWLMPDMFGLHTIVWSQAWGLLVLSSFIFKYSHVNNK